MSFGTAYATKKRAKKYAKGGEVGDTADTSTTGNKTKTGGSNPGGASTGGAGTVTITTGDKPPKSISVIGVGGKTDAANAGGMDPSDKDDSMMMAHGGMVDEHEKDADMIARIMHKRKEYSMGGMVANDVGTGQEADKLPNQFDDLVLRDELEDDHENEKNIGDPDQDKRDADVIMKIMKSRKKKDHNPRPA